MVAKTWASSGMHAQDVKPVVPIEHLIAFVLLLALNTNLCLLALASDVAEGGLP